MDEIFTVREKEVINLLLEGKSNKQIALTLGLSASTIEYHLKNIYRKLQVSSRTEAVLKLGKSVSHEITGNSGKSTVEIKGETFENGSESISTWRFPVNKVHYLISGLILAIVLAAALFFNNKPVQNPIIATATEIRVISTPTQIVVQDILSTPTPIIGADTSPLPFEYVVTIGDTCESIAATFNVSIESIQEINHLSSSCNLVDVQILLIPNPNAQEPAVSSGAIPIEFYGDWNNINIKNPDVTHVSIEETDNQPFIDVFGACQPTDCDWLGFSPTPSMMYHYDSMTGILSLQWTFDFLQAAQELTFTPDGQLKMITNYHFTDNSGRTDYSTVEYFTK